MADALLTISVVLIDLALVYAGIRIVWWLFRKFVSGTGRAWRGEL
jgi:hypothetical protein